jgi:hypothetical protein
MLVDPGQQLWVQHFARRTVRDDAASGQQHDSVSMSARQAEVMQDDHRGATRFHTPLHDLKHEFLVPKVQCSGWFVQ